MRKILLLLLIALLLLLGYTNPQEDEYLEKIAKDYNLDFHGEGLAVQLLQESGDGQYQNYILFSSYNYQFGNSGVAYFGLADKLFFINSYFIEPIEEPSQREIEI